MPERLPNPLIVALDFERLSRAQALARKVAGSAAMFKIGKQLFTAEGPRAVEQITRLGVSIFLDLKFHDIPNTVAGAVAAAADLPGVGLVNIHALGGRRMMEAAAGAIARLRNRPRLLAVTILTSMDQVSMREVGVMGSPVTRAVRLARLAQQCGLDGVVASPLEIRAIRRACGPDFLIVVPGVRPAGSRPGDQARTATPAEAIRSGADYLVIGRPIIAASSPAAAAARIRAEIAAASGL